MTETTITNGYHKERLAKILPKGFTTKVILVCADACQSAGLCSGVLIRVIVVPRCHPHSWLCLPEPWIGMDSWRGGACVLGPVVFYLSPRLPMLNVNDRLTPDSVPDRGSIQACSCISQHGPIFQRPVQAGFPGWPQPQLSSGLKTGRFDARNPTMDSI